MGTSNEMVAVWDNKLDIITHIRPTTAITSTIFASWPIALTKTLAMYSAAPLAFKPLATPSVAPTIINTFLESYDFSGKTIVPFATSGGSGMGNTNEKLAPSCPGAILMKGKMLNGSLSQEELKAWVKSL